MEPVEFQVLKKMMTGGSQLSPLCLQWTVSGPAGRSGAPAQPAVVAANREPPEWCCSPASTEGLRVKAQTTVPPPA